MLNNNQSISCNSQNNPSLNDLSKSIKNIDKDNQFYNIIQHTHQEVINFEQSKESKRNDLQIKIDTNFPSGLISLRDLNIVSSGLQRVFTSMYNNLFGKGNNRGMIPKSIADSSELVLTNASPGSFNLHLKLKKENSIIKSHGLSSICHFSKLMSQINDLNNYTKVVDDYGIRTFNILKRWFYELDKGKVEFKYTDLVHDQSVNLTSKKINKIMKHLNYIKTREVSKIMNVSGKLLAADSMNNSFEIQLGDKRIKGKTTAEIFNNELTIKRYYNFKLTKKIIEDSSTGQQTESYYLNELDEIKKK